MMIIKDFFTYVLSVLVESILVENRKVFTGIIIDL